ncbi:MAG: protein translocase subunit SecF [Gammaproteobacteria bacterium]|nr:protein translocase subunit SecF [Gammaproteobacteria bacterium]MDH4313813.1 protein translocase subunit SecF [Gammaproteobacteria bacterium]MDH5214814.1 protein translocase subunit SecF [Gammaproteobacteria bacterium]MDH5501171.1 protein translocase subunit SecF [Gammaproteobacteria bacterium]
MIIKIVKDNTSINFLGRRTRTIAVTFTVILTIATFISLGVRGLNFGIDFTGGVLLEVGYPEPADLNKIRGLLRDAGFADVQAQRFGPATDVMLRLPPQENADPDDIRRRLRNALASDEPNVELRRVEFVGPQVGKELTEKGGLAMIFTLLMIFAYVMFRFQWKFAAGAVIATAHDVIVTIGFFSIFYLPFDLTVVAAVLAVIGYSLNDTVVTFDRIRENFVRLRGMSVEDSMNKSVNEVLSRTIITALTTLFVLFALFLFGGESVGPFSIALIVGIVIGTYSSVYIASATAIYLEVSPQDLLPPAENPDLVDDMP